MTTVTFRIEGVVQGVGFRPFVFRLALRHGVAGWVRNDSEGVTVEARGNTDALDCFEHALVDDAPAAARIVSLRRERVVAGGIGGAFAIAASAPADAVSAFISPDLAVCDDCRREMSDPTDRRFAYPFINCTNCGPRYSIIQALPYDRPNTTMRGFTMCEACEAEYRDPLHRRFHAQPNACQECGPSVALWARDGTEQARDAHAIRGTADALRAGAVVAMKGLGGFHLMADARSDAAVSLLRQRKRREEKPLAVMYPSLDMACRDCVVDEAEAAALTSPWAPIALLRRRDGHDGVSDHVAPGSSTLGVMLPYTPLHGLLADDIGFPVVATSGNLSEEPICIDEREAVMRLGDIADVFLVHDRPIARQVDDSVVRVFRGGTTVLRAGRGYAPFSIDLGRQAPPVLAVGPHMKNTIAVSSGDKAFVGQHIGTLDTPQALEAYRRAHKDLASLYAHEPVAVARDLHPDYASTAYAAGVGAPTVAVQHHYAHVLSCMAEHRLAGPVLGVAWDGTGHGDDGTVWGGEFLVATRDGYERVAHLRPFRLPGGDTAAREPRRSAVGLLHAAYGDGAFAMRGLPSVAAFSQAERRVVGQMLARGVNAPLTSSAGRLFDGFASLVGLKQRVAFEGQAAMMLEQAIGPTAPDESYEYEYDAATGVLDWSPMLRCAVADVTGSVATSEIAGRYHNTLVAMIVTVARSVGIDDIVLTGGCFQNAYLTEGAVNALEAAGMQPHWHCRVPPNDGGVALGQLMAGIAQMEGCD
ncbi:carbamoyltransferase HypF [Candidatus Poribacteria bacterium]|nr:carbamoyltransferase HypF [Candidatus Poribacteria bacterium]MBT5532581.1 carbamoyltransferase HypF [Candidatus Poribacteria bacterium]MBT7101859.1 carbamoyltransferase HypF [Candidatus Poribacteria bacterium]